MAGLSFIETDSEKIYKTIITSLEKSVGEPLYPGDERRIFGDALAAVVLAICSKTNDACRQKMLKYARGNVLDALGERYACTRIRPAPAKTTLRFSLNSAITSNIIIPEGTRATPDSEVYFKTMETEVLQAGALYADVPAECVFAGASYNGYLAGSINRLVDMIPFIDSVKNVEVTYDGNDGEPYPEEDGGTGDERYRERIRLAPTALSVAGPRDAYEYHAKSADASIADVAVLSEAAGTVLIVPVLRGGRIPGDGIIQKVYDACSAEDVRPMTDLVIVRPPTAVPYDINIKYYTTADEESECIEAIEGKGGALELYKEWQGTKMGRAINPDKLRSLCLSPRDGPGCSRIEVISPAYMELGNTQIARLGTVTISHAVERG